MFTGLVEAVGRLESLERRGEGARAVVDAGIVAADLARGDSVAVNGCCLTAVDAPSSPAEGMTFRG